MTPGKTFAAAAAAYCAERAAIAEINGRIQALGACEVYEPGDYESCDPGVNRCTDTLKIGGPGVPGPDWWEATTEQLADFCPRCQAKVPLWRERRKRKARLGQLMRTMLAAYRREAVQP
jgi:hypothetical protein